MHTICRCALSQKFEIQTCFAKTHMKITNFINKFYLCKWNLLFSYEFLQNEFAPQFLWQCTSTNTLLVCIVSIFWELLSMCQYKKRRSYHQRVMSVCASGVRIVCKMDTGDLYWFKPRNVLRPVRGESSVLSCTEMLVVGVTSGRERERSSQVSRHELWRWWWWCERLC
jgi:hypothetical protein